MEDPFVFLDVYCHYSSSQEELFKNSLLAREEISPEPYSPPPSSTAAAFEGNGIIICSAPETPASVTAASPSGDEFKTPPEESRRSSSEEAPPKTLSPSHGGEFDGPGIDGGQGVSAVETDCGALDGGTLDLGFSKEGNRTPKMVEILSDGKVRVGDVSKLDLESFRVGEKRQRPVQERWPSPSPSKRIMVSVDSSVLVNTPNLECPIEIGVNVNTEVERQVNDVDSGNDEADQMIDTEVIEGYADQMIDTEVIEGYEDGKEDCGNNGGISNVEQEHEKEEEEGMENGNVDKETAVDGAEDLSKQGRRSLPQSWTCRNGGNREDENRSNTERVSSGNGMGVVMEVLRWLAREEREKRRDHGGSVDFLETVKRRGVTFPEPKWWHEQ